MKNSTLARQRRQTIILANVEQTLFLTQYTRELDEGKWH
jgi:hypothetical protein